MKDLILKLLKVEPMERLGARNPGNDMEALKKHPFFANIEWTDESLKNSNMRQLLKETEPLELKQKRVKKINNEDLPEARYGLVPYNEPILKGKLLKKNRFFMKQERLFELYVDGQIKYFNGTEQKGTMILTHDAGARKISKTDIEINLPQAKKNYNLI